MEDLEAICQFFIGVLGIIALVIVAFFENKGRRWGYVIGLLGQPFWFITSIMHHQWGVLILSIAYTIVWGYGVWSWFFAKKFF